MVDLYDLDAELLRATAERDELAFAELYRRTSARLHGVARRLMRDGDLAAEALVSGGRLITAAIFFGIAASISRSAANKAV